MTLNLVALTTAAVASIALAIAVYQRAPDRVWNRIFAVHATIIGLWAFCNFLIMGADTPEQAGLWLRLSHPLAALTACTIVDFAWVFPERIEYAPRGRRMLLYAVGLGFATVGLSPELYHSIELSDGLVDVQYGWPLLPFGAFIVIAMGYADVLLLLKAFRLEGLQRVQVIWVLIGIAGTHLVGMITIIFIPLLWGTTQYSGWGAVGLFLQLMGMSYAIARHRLIRPAIAVRRLAIAVASTVLIVGAGAATLYFAGPLAMDAGLAPAVAHMIVGVGMGAGVTLLHGWITRMAVGSDGGVESVPLETSSQILRTLDSENLLEMLASSLDEALQPSAVTVYTRARADGAELRPRVVRRGTADMSGNGRAPIDIEDRALDAVRDGSLITRDQIFRFTSLAEARRLSITMDEWDAQVMAPLIWENELIGLVTLGARRSGDMYTEEDLRFVADVALQASLAMRNADLYAETATLKDFNERILSQMDNAVVVTDDRHEIVVFNPAAERLFDLPAETALGSSIAILPAGIANCIHASFGSGRILSSRRIEMQCGETAVPVACSTSPLEIDPDDHTHGVVAVISDLTLIRELDRERAEAERLSLVRVISAGMAHEIRNPLVAIRTFAELAPRRLDDPEFRSNFLTVVREEIHRIDKLVGDLLTLSKPADAVVEEIDVEAICRRVMRAMSGVAEAKDVELALQLDRIDGCVRGDETRLHQALLNLVNNAIDAEPEGGRVTMRTRPSERQEMTLCIAVHNPGSFIPEEQVEEIWRPFVSRKSHGTGLGLAICQTIVEEHRGAVGVESTPEGGTTFVVELPLSASRTAALRGSSE